MSSLWKDLLFLHGYLVRKEDLSWRDQTAPDPAAGAPAENAAVKAENAAKGQGKPPKNRASRWPRLAAPH